MRFVGKRENGKKRSSDGSESRLLAKIKMAFTERSHSTGQYQAADRGEIQNFPGVTYSYEAPDDADLYFDTSLQSPEAIAEEVYQRLVTKWF